MTRAPVERSLLSLGALPGASDPDITGLSRPLDAVFLQTRVILTCTPQIITTVRGKAVHVCVQKRTLSSGLFPTPRSYVQENKTN